MSALLFLLFYVSGILAAFVNNATAAFVVYQLVYFVNPGIRWWYNDIPAIPYSFIAVLVMMFFLVKNYRKLSDISPWLDQAPFKWMALLLALYYVIDFVFLRHSPLKIKQPDQNFRWLILLD